MSNAALAWATRQRTNGPGQKLILLLLADRADERHSCFPGLKLLAAESQQSRRTVMRQLDALADMGLVIREQRRRKDGTRTTNRYILPVANQVTPVAPGDLNQVTSRPQPGDNEDLNQVTPVAPHEPSEEPKGEPSPIPAADAAEGVLLTLPVPKRREEPNAGHLVARWCERWTETRGTQPDPAVVKRVAGACRDIAKTRTDRDSWVTAWEAAGEAGAQGRHDVVAVLADYRPPARPGRNQIDWQAAMDRARNRDAATAIGGDPWKDFR